MFRLIRVLCPLVLLGSLLATPSAPAALPLFPGNMFPRGTAMRMPTGPAAIPRGIMPRSPIVGFPPHAPNLQFSRRLPFQQAPIFQSGVFTFNPLDRGVKAGGPAGFPFQTFVNVPGSGQLLDFVPLSSRNGMVMLMPLNGMNTMSFTTMSGSVSPAWYSGASYGGGYGGGSSAPSSNPPPAAPMTSVRSPQATGSLDLLNWPSALKVLGPAPEAQTLRQEIDTKVQQLKNQAETGSVDQDLLQQTRRDVERLRQLLTDSRGKLALAAITEGQQFLDRLMTALNQLSA